MRNAIAILLVIFTTGCFSTPKKPSIQVVDNPEKDSYIDLIENECSEAAAALEVAKKNTEGNGKKLISLAQTRLEGIKSPNIGQVSAYIKALDDDASYSKLLSKAKSVKSKTDDEYEKVKKIDEENLSLKNQLKMEKERHQQELDNEHKKNATLGLTLIGGLLIIVSQVFVFLGNPRGWLGIIAGGMIAAGPWIFDSTWFKWAAGVASAAVIIEVLIYGYQRFLRKPLAVVSSENVEQDKP